MLFVIFVCTKISFDPDNVAAPLAAALGDFFVLLIMTSVVWSINSASESGGEESDNELSEPQMPPSCGSLKFTELAVNQAISESHTSTTRLLMLCLPLHSLLLVVNHVVSLVFHEVSAHQAFSLPLILAYLTAGFLQVFVLLLFARCLVLRLWLGLAGKQRGDCAPTGPGGEWRGAGGLAALDLTAIAVTTGLGDLLGTSILAGLLHFADRS